MSAVERFFALRSLKSCDPADLQLARQSRAQEQQQHREATSLFNRPTVQCIVGVYQTETVGPEHTNSFSSENC